MTAWGTSGTPIWSYTWDGLNMMQSNNNGVRTRRYVYTADDERIAVYDATAVRWTWRLRGVDNKVLREYRQQGSTWTWQKDHVYRGSSSSHRTSRRLASATSLWTISAQYV